MSSSLQRFSRRKIKTCVGGGVFYVIRKSARAREREKLTNQRASSNFPSFFFLARSEKTYIICTRFRSLSVCHRSTLKSVLLFSITNFFVCGPPASQIFCREETKACVITETRWCVCVWGGELSCWPRHDIFSTNAIIWCADDAYRERMQE